MKLTNAIKTIREKAIFPQAFPITAHTISRNQEFAAGLYLRRGARPLQQAVGGDKNLPHKILPTSLLLRLGSDANKAESEANRIYAEFFSIAKPIHDAPIWLGADARGVFEYVIEADFYYTRPQRSTSTPKEEQK